MTIILTLACACLVVLLLLAETRSQRPLKWFAKTAASLCFVALAANNGAFDTGYGRLLLLGLVLCLLGDVLLIARTQKAFLAGMGAFALGHAAYIAAFSANWAEFSLLTAATGAAMLVLAGGALRWLWPHLDVFRGPVAAYAAIIAVMVFASAGTAPPGANAPAWAVIAGAAGFAVSDLAVARDQFVKPALLNKLWGLPLYYGSQLLLASSA